MTGKIYIAQSLLHILVWCFHSAYSAHLAHSTHSFIHVIPLSAYTTKSSQIFPNLPMGPFLNPTSGYEVRTYDMCVSRTRPEYKLRTLHNVFICFILCLVSYNATQRNASMHTAPENTRLLKNIWLSKTHTALVQKPGLSKTHTHTHTHIHTRPWRLFLRTKTKQNKLAETPTPTPALTNGPKLNEGSNQACWYISWSFTHSLTLSLIHSFTHSKFLSIHANSSVPLHISGTPRTHTPLGAKAAIPLPPSFSVVCEFRIT